MESDKNAHSPVGKDLTINMSRSWARQRASTRAAVPHFARLNNGLLSPQPLPHSDRLATISAGALNSSRVALRKIAMLSFSDGPTRAFVSVYETATRVARC